MTRARAGAIVLLPIALAACPDGPGDETGGGGSGGSPPSCELAFLGDPSLEPEIEIFFWGADELDHPVADGTELDLVEPPQGGRVLFVGARVTNVDPCFGLINGTLRDPTNNQVRFDGRSVNLDPEGDGWGTVSPGDLSVYSNIPVCPNSWSDQTVFEGDYRLEVQFVDRESRTAETSFAVTLGCTEKSLAQASGSNALEQCLCMCKVDYVLGETCEGDGGGDTGGSGGGT